MYRIQAGQTMNKTTKGKKNKKTHSNNRALMKQHRKKTFTFPVFLYLPVLPFVILCTPLPITPTRTQKKNGTKCSNNGT